MGKGTVYVVLSKRGGLDLMVKCSLGSQIVTLYPLPIISSVSMRFFAIAQNDVLSSTPK